MSVQVEFLPGPYTSETSRTSAEGALLSHPAIRKGAAYALEQLDGRWVAAIVHTAGEPPFGGGAPGGGPADSSEEAPGPKSEGPDDAEPSMGDNDGDEGPDPTKPSDGDGDESKHEKGEKGGIEHQLLDMLQQIAEALGLPIGLGDSPVPGADGPDAMTPPPAGPPHGMGGPPGAGGPEEGMPAPGGSPHQPGAAATQHVVHQRVTKPGETPPGGTPIGAPAFASVREDHPWGHMAGKVASFEVMDEIGDTPLSTIENELRSLASEIQYRVARFREDRDEHGNRVAAAVITRH